MDSSLPGLPWFAPLAEDQVRDLALLREKTLPRKGGRPPRGVDKHAQYEERLHLALQSLLPEVTSVRQRVFDLLDPLVRHAQLTKRALLDILYPAPLTPYPARLYDWWNEHFLLFDAQGNPEPQSTAAILIQRELDPRKRKLPLSRSAPHSFFCWRQDAPGRQPVAYELPLVSIDDTSDPPILQPRPEPSPWTYVLSTVWKGVSWDDPDWLISDEGAIRWVGEPTEDELAQWLSSQAWERLSIQGETELVESDARQTLRILANRLKHGTISDDAT